MLTRVSELIGGCHSIWAGADTTHGCCHLLTGAFHRILISTSGITMNRLGNLFGMPLVYTTHCAEE